MTPPPPLRWWEHAWRLGLAALVSLVAFLVTVGPLAEADYEPSGAEAFWILLADPVLGLAAFVLVLQRRRWPFVVAALTAAFSAVSLLALGPATLALASLATRRRPRELAPVVALTIAATVSMETLYPSIARAWWWVGGLAGGRGGAGVSAGGAASGSGGGPPREGRHTLRERAETNEREQQARVAAARAEERTRIAREMHDVLAHRISLVSMHAGALTYRDDLPREQQVAVARTIEDNAQLAMSDLRTVLGVLRSDAAAEGMPEPPQPGTEDLPALVAEAEVAGMRVLLDNQLTQAPPATTGRTLYRIVQECLTNARKHAPACSVTVSIEGGPGEGVEVVVSNPLPVGAASPERLRGLGLLGLDERVALLGGSLDHGETGGRFVVRASLPWAA